MCKLEVILQEWETENTEMTNTFTFVCLLGAPHLMNNLRRLRTSASLQLHALQEGESLQESKFTSPALELWCRNLVQEERLAIGTESSEAFRGTDFIC